MKEQLQKKRKTAAEQEETPPPTPLTREEKALKTACNILGYADRSQKKLSERLKQKGFTAQEAQNAVDAVVAAGILREQQQAQALCDYMAQSQWYGKHRIVNALYQKGYPVGVIQALDFQAYDFFELCQKRMERFCARQIEQWRQAVKTKDRKNAIALQNKLLSYAVRYGFTIEQARSFLENAL